MSLRNVRCQVVSVLQLPDADWDAAVKDFLADKRGSTAEKTAKFYECQLRLVARWAVENGVTLPEFKARHMRQYLSQRRDHGLSDRTCRSDAVVMKNFLKFCFHEEYIASNPLADYQAPKAAKPYVKMPSDDEIRLILQTIEDKRKPGKNPNSRFCNTKMQRFLGRRDRAIVTGLVSTAARAGEILGLKLGDYDKARKQIVFRETKGNEPRIVPIEDAWIEAVDAWLRVRGELESDLLFVTLYGEPIDVRCFSRQFHRYCEFGKVEDVTLHSLRHYALTTIAKSDLWAASLIAGHKHLRVTRGYLHNDPDHVRQAHAAAAPLTRILVHARSQSARRKRVV